MRKLLAFLALIALLAPSPANAWWEQGHRLVGRVAWDHLTPVARANVKALLGTESLADVAAWADVYRPLVNQTFGWHFTDIPGDKTTYDRDRDCPLQPGVKAGSYNDKWRDCNTDRILFFEQRVADTRLDPSERAESLKFLVHFVGDIHQPFHATGVEKGGNGIVVTAYGHPTCSEFTKGAYVERPNASKCNLHSVWDGYLISRRLLTDAQYLKVLEDEIKSKPPVLGENNPVLWTEQSKAIADAVTVAPGTDIDEAYFQKNMPIIDRQLELGGLRLAAALNAAFTSRPTVFHPAPVK
jgi:hypothetical protein